MPDSETLRAFIAIPVSAQALEELVAFQKKLKKRMAAALRWCQPEQMHLTLKFLGEVEASQSAELEAALRRACEGTPPFILKLDRLLAFPSLEKPNVVCVGLSGELEALAVLQQRIERETQPFSGHSESRPFVPHLTLARVKEFRMKHRVGEILATQEPVFSSEWRVSTVELIRSELLPHGPKYTRLAEVPLRVESVALP